MPLLLLVVAANARAEPAQPVVIDPVVVTASRLPQSQSESNAAISVVGKGDIQDGRTTIGLEEPLNRVPGVFVQNSGNYAQDARIQIRGFGTRAGFGVREIKVFTDGIPETLPDGQTELDSVDLGAVQHIEVVRGAASSLYGNASGGVIQLFTEDAPQSPSLTARPLGGSYGLQKYQLKGGARRGAWSLFSNASYFDTDGYRHHSAARSTVVTSKLRYDIDEDSDVTFLFTGVDAPTGDDPGALTRTEADADPKRANPLNVRLDAGESVQQGRLGSVFRHGGNLGEISGYAYILYRDFENRLPILPQNGEGVVAFDRLSPGAGIKWSLAHDVASVGVQWLAGLDVQHQDDNRRRYANLNGETGELRLHQRERVTGVGPYARVAVSPWRELELSIGARFDHVVFDVDPETPESAPNSSRRFNQWSPSGGARYTLLDWMSVFGNIGTAFQVPTTTELGNPDGPGFNPDIEPQSAINYELGLRFEGESRWRAEIVGFIIDIDDELIRFESTSGRTAFRNAGTSRRGGVEIDAVVELLPGLRWTNSLSILHAVYRSYRTSAGDFGGNDEPGIPDWRVFEELHYQHPIGLFAALEANLVGDSYVDDANFNRSHGYELVNLRAGYEYSSDHWSIEPFVGLNNLTDAEYDGTVRLNALAGRFYEPAPGFNVFGGLRLSAAL